MKWLYCLVRAIVAPWLGPSAQLHGPRIIPHQMPIYFIGLNQLTSPSLLGSLRLSSRSFSTSPAASSAMRIVRHGVWKGRSRTTRGPPDEGARAARNFRSEERRVGERCV